MSTTAELRARTKADLAKMAKSLGISGCSAMLKDELVTAVAKAERSRGRAVKNGKAKSSKPAGGGAKPSKSRSTAARSRKSTATNQAKGDAVVVASKSTKSKSPKSKTSKSKAAKVKASASKSSPKPARSPQSSRSTKRQAPASSKSAKSNSKPTGRKALATAKAKESTAPKRRVDSKKSKPKPKAKPTNPRVLKRIRELQLEKESSKDISFQPTLIRPPGASEPIWEKEPQRDRVALFVRDAFWMHASWDITRHAVERAKAAMAEQWHGSQPILRLLRLDDNGTTSATETVERDIEIRGGLRNWYIDWKGEPATFRVMIGYLALNGRFHSICESNIVSTPAAGTADDVDEHWSDLGASSEKLYAMSGGYNAERETGELKELLEDRLNRELGAPALAKIGAISDSPFRRRSDFHFDMDIELVLYGSTVPDGYLTLNGEPVSLREDGTFAMRLPFPDRRQVLPAVAVSRDGSQQRTIVVAVERNTKIMEPLEKEHDLGE